MSVELILNAVNLNLIAFALMHGNVDGQVFALYVIAVAAAEGGPGRQATTGSGWTMPSLRYVLVNMIEEYARHNGHADLIREVIDGRVGIDPPEASADPSGDRA